MSLAAPPPRFALPIHDLVGQLRTNPRWADGVVLDRELPARAARFAPWPDSVPDVVRSASARLGASRLYVHQAEAIGLLEGGDHVAVVAGTASGKSLCYQLPIAQALLADPRATAICLYPTKALARDQLTRFEAWDRALSEAEGELLASGPPPSGRLGPVAYDGDTPSGQRAALRRQARVLLTNPDMLHLSLLPRHPAWAEFFEGLAFVVIDEMHVYRGVFGSHVANVLRRLNRSGGLLWPPAALRLASATIANPDEQAHPPRRARRCARRRGWRAARRQRSFLFYNPPLVNREMNLRRSALLESRSGGQALHQQRRPDHRLRPLPTVGWSLSRATCARAGRTAFQPVDASLATVATAAATWPPSAGQIEQPACAAARSAASSPPTPWSWGSTSASWRPA